ncbi:uncharacterized protein LY89DRAFT_784671 [Mollisia scopiformis]|uniref:Uncharacterized protein n=1 Tax=Mollisia scopiformis TaxID=149040 RepID=A0A194X0T1_MOLSC|nr:uncharacterized protein LY89DRAFT_784671 [Mollisia scopiformis]KUJ13806.1 hypothetical protein LY89DRAFT_784671 [Mollisia scopiformis]
MEGKEAYREVSSNLDSQDSKYIDESREQSPQAFDDLKRPEPDPYPLLSTLPESVASFFSTVSSDGFPPDLPKAQPWRQILAAPLPPQQDGKLIIACPKKCLYGSNNG